MKTSVHISSCLTKLGTLFHSLANKIYREPFSRDVARSLPWFAIRGDETLRLDYDLTPESIVFDVGGYKGEWAMSIAAMYGCRIHIFEPVSDFAKHISRKLRRNPNIIVHSFGLAGQNRIETIGVDENRSSTFLQPAHVKPAEDIKMVDVVEFLGAQEITSVDLLKINIEGGEYELIERLLDSNLVTRIHNLQVQFHDFVPNALERMRSIRDKLQNTHRLTYCYDFVWENWQRIEVTNLSE